MLDGKAIVITGSGRGIGAACAKGCARQGAAVVINDIDSEVVETTVAQITEAGGTAEGCVADITRWEDAGRLVESCISAFGRIDGLVNNAGLFHVAPLAEFDPAAARSLVDVNVLGSLHCAAHAVKPMLAQGSGSIVNVVSGAHLGIPGMGIYGATKGAAASMVYTWALELAGTGVRVNGLSPSGITRMVKVIEKTLSAEQLDSRLAAAQPPEANSPVVEYLLSDRATHVNGQLVRIDKGELQLYTHPALLVPPAVRGEWTAEDVARAFDSEFLDRLVPCGVLGMKELPTALDSGYWSRVASSDKD